MFYLTTHSTHFIYSYMASALLEIVPPLVPCPREKEHTGTKELLCITRYTIKSSHTLRKLITLVLHGDLTGGMLSLVIFQEIVQFQANRQERKLILTLRLRRCFVINMVVCKMCWCNVAPSLTIKTRVHHE